MRSRDSIRSTLVRAFTMAYTRPDPRHCLVLARHGGRKSAADGGKTAYPNQPQQPLRDSLWRANSNRSPRLDCCWSQEDAGGVLMGQDVALGLGCWPLGVHRGGLRGRSDPGANRI